MTLAAEPGTLADHWHELVTASLLGTDRREPPPPPPGGVADVVADTVRDTPSGRMLADVAATVVARRAGLRPHPATTALAAAPPDDRPMIRAAAARRWRQVVVQWPVLEDEWVAVATDNRWRPSPDVAVGLLQRHRQDPVRRAQACCLLGPLAAWLVGHQPQLAAPTGRRTGVPIDLAPPELPVPPELQQLLGAGSAAVVPAVIGAFRAGDYAIAHRSVLVNFVARVSPEVLPALASALRGLPPEVSVAHALAELAATRCSMLEELEPAT